MDNDTLSYIDKEIILEVGESKKVKLSFINNVTLIYSGMPNKETFSIAILNYSGYQGYGYNLFYQKDTKYIKVRNKTFRVVNVSPERITIV